MEYCTIPTKCSVTGHGDLRTEHFSALSWVTREFKQHDILYQKRKKLLKIVKKIPQQWRDIWIIYNVREREAYRFV